MSRWLDAEIAAVRQMTPRPVALVNDPHRLVPTERFGDVGEVVSVEDWWSLRRTWERFGRRRTWADGRLVIHVVAALPTLPWDIETQASVRNVMWPVRPEWRALFSALSPEDTTDLMVAANQRHASTREMLESLLGLPLTTGTESGDLSSLAALRGRLAIPDAVWTLVSSIVTTPLARALASQPPDMEPLIARWIPWLKGQSEDMVLADTGPALLGLVAAGLLPRTASVDASRPDWARLAKEDADPVERARNLFDSPPIGHDPDNVADWSAFASWLGTVRGLIAQAPAAPQELVGKVFDRAKELDTAFEPWLRTNYGPLLQRTASPPLTVNKIAPFLARRLSDGAERVLLVVLDGVGFAQWEVILEHARLAPMQQAACVAMLPTETAISRQAIVAGETPDNFATSWRQTDKDSQRWSEFWAVNDLPDCAVEYKRVDGLPGDSVPLSTTHRAVAVIVSAVDKLMHGSDLLGDVQLVASVRAWCEQGFLSGLLDDARELGFETWMTSDHGNVQATSGHVPREGLRVDKAGTRFRIYRERATRDAAAQHGIAWTPPRLPPDAHVLFAPARTGFHPSGKRVTHGGISLEEVIVPLARMT